MKILYLTSDNKDDALTEMHVSMHKAIGSVDYRRLSKDQLMNLDAYVENHIDFSKHDRIVFNLSFGLLTHYVRILEKIPNLVLIDRESHIFHNGTIIKSYFNIFKILPWARVVTSCYNTTNALLEETIDACCLPKGFDEMIFSNKEQPRKYEIGSIGVSTTKNLPKKDKLFLDLKKRIPQIFLANNLDQNDYERLLHEIKIYISAYIDYESYGRKIFEAMASGCIVFAYNIGESANIKCGFRDLHNIVLYKDIDSLLNKIEIIKSDNNLAEKIIKNSTALVHKRYSYSVLGKSLAKIIESPCRNLKDYPEPRFIFGIRV